MEFADLILSSKIDNVTLHSPHNRPLDGILCITGHHLIVSSRKEGGQELWVKILSLQAKYQFFVFMFNDVIFYFQLLHSNIDHIDRKQANNVQLGGSLVFKCKDLRILQLDLNTLEDYTNVAVSLERLINIDDTTKLYPFFYRPMYNIIEDGWTAFRPETEFNKLVTTCSDEWRISYVNQNFKVRESKFMLPKDCKIGKRFCKFINPSC